MKRHPFSGRNTGLSLVLSAAFLGAPCASLFFSGCGGGNSSPSTSVFAGTYAGTFTGGATGNLTLSISSAGLITGTLDTSSFTPNAARVMDSGRNVSAIYTGSSLLRGDGSFNIEFLVGGGGTASFSGQFARANNLISTSNLKWNTTSGLSGTYTLTQTGTAPTSTPIPGTTATAAPTVTPTTGATAIPVDCSVTNGSATFSNVSSNNAITTAFNKACANGAIIRSNSQIASVTLAFADAPNTTTARAVTFTVNALTGNVSAGQTYSLGLLNIATYNQTNTTTNVSQQWVASSGSIKLDSIVGNTISATFSNVKFAPATITQNPITPGNGTFTLLSGTVKINASS